MSKPLSVILAEDEFDDGKSEVLELPHKGKLTKFHVISREWNDEKVGFDLTLQTVAGKNWRHSAKEYRAFQLGYGNAEISFI